MTRQTQLRRAFKLHGKQMTRAFGRLINERQKGDAEQA